MVDRSGGDTAEKRVSYVDGSGKPTDDPALAVRGEIAELDAHGRTVRRTKFFLGRSELPWLPVSEAAFLLWVLAALIIIWACIGIALRLA
jgi:hypothetical protein